MNNGVLYVRYMILKFIHGSDSFSECRTGDIFKELADVKTVDLLLREGLRILQFDFPKLTLEQVSGWIENSVLSFGTDISPMLMDVMAGKESEIDYVNGWLVKRGRQNTLQYRAPLMNELPDF